jgi:hypothetical protein
MGDNGLNDTQVNTVRSVIVSFLSGNKISASYYLSWGFENNRVLMHVILFFVAMEFELRASSLPYYFSPYLQPILP